MSSTETTRFTVARRSFEISAADVERVMTDVLPEPTTRHFIVVNWRRYPPKQVIGEVTGLDRADFTSHQARRILMNLGFPAGRRPAPVDRARVPVTHGENELAAELRRFTGQWVAVADDELLVADPSPHAVVSWLARHDRKADSMFRVPEDELAASGLAPL